MKYYEYYYPTKKKKKKKKKKTAHPFLFPPSYFLFYIDGGTIIPTHNKLFVSFSSSFTSSLPVSIGFGVKSKRRVSMVPNAST